MQMQPCYNEDVQPTSEVKNDARTTMSDESIWQVQLFEGHCLDILPTLASSSVNLIVTSPPYADQRKDTYGGIHPDEYVEWFLPISAELKRVLKPEGSFILNIKERVVNGERHSYVLRNMFGISVIAIRVSGLIAFVMDGNVVYISLSKSILQCIKMLFKFRW